VIRFEAGVARRGLRGKRFVNNAGQRSFMPQR
jgi:hypothetical protein